MPENRCCVVAELVRHDPPGALPRMRGLEEVHQLLGTVSRRYGRLRERHRSLEEGGGRGPVYQGPRLLRCRRAGDLAPASGRSPPNRICEKPSGGFLAAPVALKLTPTWATLVGWDAGMGDASSRPDELGRCPRRVRRRVGLIALANRTSEGKSGMPRSIVRHDQLRRPPPPPPPLPVVRRLP